MRKFYILGLVVTASFSFAQTYQFDFLTRYGSSISNTTFETVRYNNTNDFSYFLNLFKDVNDFMAILYDRNSKIIHHFSVVESKVGQEIEFHFTYEYSRKTNYSEPNNLRIEISEISESPKIISLKTYTSKRAKKPIAECIMTLRKANKNLILLYRSDALLWNSDTKGISDIGNYIIAESQEKYRNNTYKAILKEYKNVNFQLTLPKVLKF